MRDACCEEDLHVGDEHSQGVVFADGEGLFVEQDDLQDHALQQVGVEAQLLFGEAVSDEEGEVAHVFVETEYSLFETAEEGDFLLEGGGLVDSAPEGSDSIADSRVFHEGLHDSGRE